MKPVKHLFPHLIPRKFTASVTLKKLTQWGSRGPVVHINGKLRYGEIDDIVAKRNVGKNTRQLRINDLEYYCKKLSLGDIVVTGDHSTAADTNC
jgi:hypothetical protein